MQNINWKHLASTTGYKSLKAAMIVDIQDANKSRQRGYRPMRDKAEFYIQFRKIIRHATRYANFHEVPVHEVLDKWEEQRGQWWMNYPGLQQQATKLEKSKPWGLNALRKYWKTFGHNEASFARQRVMKHIQEEQMKVSTKGKARWSNEKKAAAKKLIAARLRLGL